MTEHILQIVIDPSKDAHDIAGRLAAVEGVMEVRIPTALARADEALDAARTIALAPGAAVWYSGKDTPYTPLDIKQSPAHMERAYRLAVDAASKLEGTYDLITAYAAARDTLLDAQR